MNNPKPFKNRLLIEPIEVDTVMVSVDQKYQQIGKVIEVGWRPWYMFWKPRFVNIGDTIIFNTWGADVAKVEEKEYWFILENDDFLLGKI